ncbi:fimbria/pilus periplasmic chaperone [Rahnella sp. FRB 231]|uniref:Fimbria/pilus periplasmic chaperone n=2 Tax=Rahnella ecdela TaxID=2816250 RepID=A0ABS6LAV9_9GAMM|nr:fimbria/pilus periplasmic chaperone [Rahnella ecdela]
MRSVCLLLLALLCVSSAARAGVVIGGTRVVYGENKSGKQSGVSLSLRNNSDYPWLIKSLVISGGVWPGTVKSNEKSPFIITPPLFVLKGGRESAVRIINLQDNLPKDRESLFTLTIASIPSGKISGNSVQIAVRSQLKLLYRPASLKGNVKEAYKKLRWKRTAKRLIIENPTPYYVTLFDVQINGHPIRNAGMVAPFSKRETAWCQQKNAACPISWKSINDYGGITPAVSLRAGDTWSAIKPQS